MELRLKRVYDEASPRDGCRVLVDRIWPRGLRKERARIDHWLKEIAPSTELRKWFGHEPGRWDEFVKRYHAELDDKPDDVAELRRLALSGPLTLLYAARDTMHNNAAALKAYLEDNP